MNDDLQDQIAARRAIEDRAAHLGRERREANRAQESNSHAIMQLLRDAEGTGVTYDYLAHLTGVSRQTLYRWREEVSSKLRPGGTAADVTEMLSQRNADGHFTHYKG